MAARYGRRMRRGAAGTVVAAAAMAALSASQAPGFLPTAHAAETVTPPPGPAIDGGSPYITDLPPLNTPTGPVLPGGSASPGTGVTGGTGLPAGVYDAYHKAENAVAADDPGCRLPWELLAAIGQVESNQARGGAVDAEGTTLRPILGPVLDGVGFANISDTDHGAFDGDPVHDRAVGPMQFIPSTWATWGADGNGDGRKDPNNVYDAALAAGHYLCADGRDLSDGHDRARAILGYNHSQEYLATVSSWYEHFRKGGAVTVPDIGGGLPGGYGAPSASPSVSRTPQPGVSPSARVSGMPSPFATPGSGIDQPTVQQGSPSPSASTPSGTPSSTPSATPPSTATGTPSESPSTTPGCPTATPTPSDTTSPTPTPTGTPSPSDSPSVDPCATPSPTASPSASLTSPTSATTSAFPAAT